MVGSLHKIAHFLAFGFLCISCNQNDAKGGGMGISHQNRIVAGPNEASFSERYSLDIELPMPERDFFSIINRLKLYYDYCGERGSSIGMPVPRQESNIDLSLSKKCIQIYGDKDENKRMAKYYRAFSDENENIIYVENAFAYTGP